MEIIQFDFFNDTKNEWFRSFCKYFKLSEEKVAAYFATVDCNQLTPGKLTKDLNLNLLDYDSGYISVVCRHMTTSSPSDVESFIFSGVLDLRCMLQEKTPLSEFLNKYGIIVNVDTRNNSI